MGYFFILISFCLTLVIAINLSYFKRFVPFYHSFINNECKTDNYDYFMFALQYKPGICNIHNCKKNINNNSVNWTIHGLWPNKKHRSKNNENIFFCKNEDFIKERFDINLISDLNIYWPSLFGKFTNDNFHSHEWKKHGSCMNYCKYKKEHTSAEEFYFKKSLELREKFNPENIFIYRKNDVEFITSYLYEEIINKFKEYFKTAPILICKNKNKTQILTEIRFLLDTDFNPVKDIYSDNKSNCDINKHIHIINNIIK
jgi:ribonuclease I